MDPGLMERRCGMNSTEFKPCPFCGDKMTGRGGTLQHVEQGEGKKRCPIAVYAWPCENADRWNMRYPQTTEGQVRVKPLEWKDSFAHSIGGFYHITLYEGAFVIKFHGSSEETGLAVVDTFPEAMTIADKHHECRISAALEPADTGTIQALAESVRTTDRFFRECLPKLSVKDSALDANAIDAWNKAEVAMSKAIDRLNRAEKGGAA